MNRGAGWPGESLGEPGALFPWLSLLVAVVALLLHLGVQLALLVGPLEGLVSEGRLGVALSLATLVSAPLSLALLLAFLRSRKLPSRMYLGLIWPGWRSALLGLGGLLAILGAYEVARHLVGRPLVPPLVMALVEGAGWREALLLCLAVAGVVALYEELLFRGFLLPGLARSRLGAPGAVVVTAALWAGLHGQYDLFDLTAVFALGLLFGVLRAVSGSTLLTAFLHGLVNLLALAEGFWLLR